ncbi:hypothetical protein SAE02_70490 [Skermanella aerolata]|uniref:Uncharacterized protein n=1 Tax=Skermanella aerolata TaxID=393310 RepID=A0A512E2F6_9PROT|nr:hypothetical protein [Skermanella aerolata]KJB91386.1 hypothetical protein N826_30545 [Skermanella aerolata KACC 11604]GEO42901.1 hypothetical protein SAE02_70490 [Skermanella aerolata]
MTSSMTVSRKVVRFGDFVEAPPELQRRAGKAWPETSRLPAILHREGAGFLERSGFAPMAAVLIRHPSLALCLAIPLLGCLILGFAAGGLPGLVVGLYLAGLAALLGRDSFAELARNCGNRDSSASVAPP